MWHSGALLLADNACSTRDTTSALLACKKVKEMKREDFAFRREFNEKPSIINTGLPRCWHASLFLNAVLVHKGAFDTGRCNANV